MQRKKKPSKIYFGRLLLLYMTGFRNCCELPGACLKASSRMDPCSQLIH